MLRWVDLYRPIAVVSACGFVEEIMNLLLCAVSLAIAAIWLKITTRHHQRLVKPFWVNETFVLYFSAPVISGLMALGFIFALKTIVTFPPSLSECGYATLIFAITFWQLRALNKREAETDQQASGPAGRRIDVAFGVKDHAPRNDNNSPNNPHFKKAA